MNYVGSERGARMFQPAAGRSMRVCDDPVGAVGLIGPNAIIQVAEALGAARARPVFEVAGLAHYLDSPPDKLVPQRDVRALHGALQTMLGRADARRVSCDAGVRTARYLLANRIPRTLRLVLRGLPAWLAGRILLSIIRRHAWTFCGTADFRVSPAPPWHLTVSGCILCRGVHSDVPACDFYAAFFGTLFRSLVHPGAKVTEIGCTAVGGSPCVFELSW